jgi:hypothetical protein
MFSFETGHITGTWNMEHDPKITDIQELNQSSIIHDNGIQYKHNLQTQLTSKSSANYCDTTNTTYTLTTKLQFKDLIYLTIILKELMIFIYRVKCML